MRILIFIIALAQGLLFSSCSIFGIHFDVHNPNKPGKIPIFSNEEVLLGELTPERTCFDVKYYDLSVTINPEEKHLSGAVEIYSEAVSDFETFQLDLHSNFEITSLLDLSSGEELVFTRKERAIFITMNKKIGDEFAVKVSYHGKPVVAKKPPWKGGFVWKKDDNKKPWVGVACESEGASIWWPLKDHTSDEPDSMRMHFSVPKSVMAVGNGQFEGKVEHEDLTTYNWFVSYPINTYNVTVYLGDFVKFTDYYTGINGQELDLDYYVLPYNLDTAKVHFKQVSPILKVYEEKFGEYPWYRDGFKLVESAFAGMEHQTAIAYGNGYENDADSVTDYIILHEIAHEWWGNSVTVHDLSDVWIQEGFATYAEALYMEAKGGKEAYEEEMLWSRIMIGNKYPVIGIEGRRWFDSKKNSDVYGKGAWILHTLRNHMENDSLFFDIIHTFYESNKYKIVSSNDFVELVNQKTGSDYTWFFKQYLFNNYAPELEYYVNEFGTVFYKWVNTDESFNKIKIKLTINDSKYVITPTNQVQEMVHIKKPGDRTYYYYYEIDGMSAFCAFKKNNKLRIDRNFQEWD
jgi:aminopeptidase N